MPLIARFDEARPAGFEPATYGLEVRCSIQLSYGRGGLSVSCEFCLGRDSNGLGHNSDRPCFSQTQKDPCLRRTPPHHRSNLGPTAWRRSHALGFSAVRYCLAKFSGVQLRTKVRGLTPTMAHRGGWHPKCTRCGVETHPRESGGGLTVSALV